MNTSNSTETRVTCWRSECQHAAGCYYPDVCSERPIDHHAPLAVVTVEGMPFVKCSCRDDVKPQSAVWLRDHWRGSQADGVAALEAVVARRAGCQIIHRPGCSWEMAPSCDCGADPGRVNGC
jgi:hypothetical protein